MRTIHIQGFAEEINLREELTSYKFDLFSSGDFPYGENGEEIKTNVFFRFYTCDSKCSLETAMENNLKGLFGAISAVGSCYGYSEVTIEGFDISELTLGGHNLENLIKSQGKKYLHILIDVVRNYL